MMGAWSDNCDQGNDHDSVVILSWLCPWVGRLLHLSASCDDHGCLIVMLIDHHFGVCVCLSVSLSLSVCCSRLDLLLLVSIESVPLGQVIVGPVERPCGYSDLSLLVHSDSSDFNLFSISDVVCSGLGVRMCRIWTVRLFRSLPHLFFLKYSYSVPGWRVSLICLMCLAYLLFMLWAVWPTYCLPQCLHWIR